MPKNMTRPALAPLIATASTALRAISATSVGRGSAVTGGIGANIRTAVTVQVMSAPTSTSAIMIRWRNGAVARTCIWVLMDWCLPGADELVETVGGSIRRLDRAG
jgi:hypothetical protein